MSKSDPEGPEVIMPSVTCQEPIGLGALFAECLGSESLQIRFESVSSRAISYASRYGRVSRRCVQRCKEPWLCSAVVEDPIAVPAGRGKKFQTIWVFQSYALSGPHVVKSLRRRPKGLFALLVVALLPCSAMLRAAQVEWTCALIPGLCRSLGAAPGAVCLDAANCQKYASTSVT